MSFLRRDLRCSQRNRRPRSSRSFSRRWRTLLALASSPVWRGRVATSRPVAHVARTCEQAFELLREVVPGIRRLAIMANADYPPAVRELDEVEIAAHTLGIETIALKIRRAADIALAFEALKGRAEALYVVAKLLTGANQVRINSFALAARLPTMHVNRARLETGGFVSYGPNFPSLHRRAADYVDKILRGAKPADIPVEQPSKFDLIINLTTAKAIGLKVPEFLAPRRRGDRMRSRRNSSRCSAARRHGRWRRARSRGSGCAASAC